MGHLNIEFKARSNRIEEQESIIKSRDARFIGTDQQTDTYFNVPDGRLKLREGNQKDRRGETERAMFVLRSITWY